MDAGFARPDSAAQRDDAVPCETTDACDHDQCQCNLEFHLAASIVKEIGVRVRTKKPPPHDRWKGGLATR